MILEPGVSHIPDKLAYGCTALKQVILPDTLESVGRNVWEHTPFLDSWIEGQTAHWPGDQIRAGQQPENRREKAEKEGAQSSGTDESWREPSPFRRRPESWPEAHFMETIPLRKSASPTMSHG